MPPDLPASPAETYRRPGEETSETMAPARPAATLWRIASVSADDLDRSPKTPTGLAQAESSEYRLVKLIGRGGMGEVWEAVQASLGRVVAVKRLTPRRLLGKSGQAHQAEFRQEAMLYARLQQPNIVPVYDLGVDEAGASLLAMKLVEGDTWDTVPERDFPQLSPPDFLGRHVPILVGVAQAVAFAHSRGIIHRDIKPSQVMLGEFGEVLLTDWGLPTRATATNPSGTPALMAPEQTEDTAHNLGPWTDVFLLGATLYLLLTGSYPYSSPESDESFRRAATHQLERPEQRAPDRQIPEDLADLAMEAMAFRPEDRVASAQRFIGRLQDYLTGVGRGSRAEVLATDARALLDEGANGYAAYSGALAACAEALHLWPECEAAARVAERAHIQYARAALDNGELILARLQAKSLPPSSSNRDTPLARVDHAEDALAAQARQRTFFMRAATGSLAALVVVATIAFLAVRSSLRRVEQALASETEARALAQASLDEPEDLLVFMIADQYPKLQALRQLELLLPVADRAIAYYERRLQQEGSVPRVTRLQWARTLGVRASCSATRAASWMGWKCRARRSPWWRRRRPAARSRRSWTCAPPWAASLPSPTATRAGPRKRRGPSTRPSRTESASWSSCPATPIPSSGWPACSWTTRTATSRTCASPSPCKACSPAPSRSRNPCATRSSPGWRATSSTRSSARERSWRSPRWRGAASRRARRPR